MIDSVARYARQASKNTIPWRRQRPPGFCYLYDFILAIVEFLDDGAHRVHYARRPFQREPDFGVTSVNYDFAELIGRAEVPS